MSIDNLAYNVERIFKEKQWWNWPRLGAYIHLETSELVEATRGKGDPLDEAGDVFMNLLALMRMNDLSFAEVVEQTNYKLEQINKTLEPDPEERLKIKPLEWKTNSSPFGPGLKAIHKTTTVFGNMVIREHFNGKCKYKQMFHHHSEYGLKEEFNNLQQAKDHARRTYKTKLGKALTTY